VEVEAEDMEVRVKEIKEVKVMVVEVEVRS
jgi:hypothetical protein